MRLVMGRGSWSVLGVVVVAALSGCPSQTVEDDDGTGGPKIGEPCTVDEECNGAICQGGVCTAPVRNDGGTASGSTSSSSGSGGSGGSSGEMPDAGPPDAYVPMGVISTTPETGPIEFGAQRIGQTVEKTVIVSNVGDAPFNILQVGIRYVGQNPAQEFAVVPVGMQPASLEPNQQFTLRIQHTPVDGTPDNAFLSLTTTATNPLHEVELIAEFKGDPTITVHDDVADMGPDATELNIGAVPFEGEGTGHLYVKNTGAADSALTVTAVRVEPANGQFSVSAGPLPRSISLWQGECADTTTCAPTATACTSGLCVAGTEPDTHPIDLVDVAVRFTASTPGAASAEVVIEARVNGMPQERRIPVRAIASVGRLVVSPSPIDFGNWFLGRSRTLTVTITNEGNAVANIASIGLLYGVPVGVYTLDTLGITFPYAIAPMGSLPIEITFTPQSTAAYPEQLVVQMQGLPTTTNTVISGVGVYEPEVEKGPDVDFGPVYVGTTKTLTTTITNRERGDLYINRVFVEPSNSTLFSFAPTVFPDPILRNDSFTFQLTYAPTLITGMADNATLVVETNDPDMPEVRYALTGTSVQPVANLQPSPAVLNFGSILVGSSATQNVTIRNAGIGDLLVSGTPTPVDTNGVAVPEFEVVVTDTAPEGLVAPGSADNITYAITFRPSSAVAYTGTFRLQTNDEQLRTIDVTMNGTGLDCPARANASVMNVGGTCVYSCNSGFHECGTSCLSNTSPDSCGTRCDPCENRPHTARGCTSSTSTCTYSCTTNYHDLNNDRNAAQTASSNGCEYACIYASSNESCNDADDDCDGNVDEGLPLESNGDPGDTCPDNTTRISVGDSSSQSGQFKLYRPALNGDDEDWIRVRYYETDTGVGSCNPFSDEKYRTRFTLSNIPTGRNYNMEVYMNTCSGTRRATYQSGTTDESVSFDYTGCCGCSGDDEEFFYVHIFPASGSSPATSCAAYTLTVQQSFR